MQLTRFNIGWVIFLVEENDQSDNIVDKKYKVPQCSVRRTEHPNRPRGEEKC